MIFPRFFLDYSHLYICICICIVPIKDINIKSRLARSKWLICQVPLNKPSSTGHNSRGEGEERSRSPGRDVWNKEVQPISPQNAVPLVAIKECTPWPRLYQASLVYAISLLACPAIHSFSVKVGPAKRLLVCNNLTALFICLLLGGAKPLEI